MRTVIINIAMLGGVFFGFQWGLVTGLIGGVVSVGLGLLCFELRDGRDTSKGFLLRNRAELLGALGALLGAILGGLLIGGLPGGVLGAVGGGWIADRITDGLGWTGSVFERAFNLRAAYVHVLASAALADGQVSTREREKIGLAAHELFAEFGQADDYSITQILAMVTSSSLTMAQVQDVARLLTPEMCNALQYDVFRVLFSDGGLSDGDHRWLGEFLQLPECKDSLVCHFFIRQHGAQSGQRSKWLQEFGLSGNPTNDEIKTAYRKLASEYHPDKLQHVPPQIRALAEAKMVNINGAYQGLMGKQSAPSDLFFLNPSTGKSFMPHLSADHVCACWLCKQQNRLQQNADPALMRCGNCHALLGLGFDPTAS